MYERDQASNPKLPEELDGGQRVSPTGAEGAVRALALQRSAGNRSVSAHVARAPDPPKAEEKPKAETAPGPGGLATLSEVGAIPLLSVSLPGGGGPGGAGGSRERPVTKEISFTSSTGDHSPGLFKAMSDGRQMTVDVLMSGGAHLTLTGAMVSSYQVSGGGDKPAEFWSLAFEAWTWT